VTNTERVHEWSGRSVVDSPQISASARNQRVVITSPGTIDMAGIASLAKALKRPVGILAKAIHQAPTVLAQGLTVDQQTLLVEAARELGMRVDGEADDRELELDLGRYDLAVHITDPESIPHAIEVVSGVVGVDPEQAYQMLATPPGSIIGDISLASVSAVTERFGSGVQVSITESGTGPFDLFVPAETPSNAEVERLCGGTTGLVRLGLDRDEAGLVFHRLPKGSVRLVARDLVRCDVVFERGADRPSEAAVTWLAERFGVEPGQIPTLLAHAPIALAEALSYEQAQDHAESAKAVGLPVTAAPAGFGRFAIVVVEASDMTALSAALDQAQMPVPDALPATVATGLGDLDARWSAYQLASAGATVVFEECP